MHDYLSTSLNAFSRIIRESQLAGTLEALLSTQTSLPTIILSSAAYPFLWTSLSVVLYLVLGVGLFGVHLTGNWAAAGLILILAIVVFSGFGILSKQLMVVSCRLPPIRTTVIPGFSKFSLPLRQGVLIETPMDYRKLPESP